MRAAALQGVGRTYLVESLASALLDADPSR